MLKLTKDLFGTEFEPIRGPFGLYTGKMCLKSLVHNGGWYNKHGERIGWGDLDIDDFERIAKEIGDEWFIVLSEGDAYWNFVTDYGPIGCMCGTKPDVTNPGLDYVTLHARFAFHDGVAFLIQDDSWSNPPNPKEEVLTTTELKKRVVASLVKEGCEQVIGVETHEKT